jgi:hypothetical protein
MNFPQIRRLVAFVAFIIIVGLSAAQQPGTAKVQVTVSPEEAYIFIDGHPYDHRSQTLNLAPGEYTIGIYNYGFIPQVEKVRLVAGNNPAISASLMPIANRVSGPWGRIQIEGNPDDTAAVFLNGTTPEYFVGHVDEMNHAIWAAQQLIVPVGTYQMFIVHPRQTKPFWSGKVDVHENQRLVVDIAKGPTEWKYMPWEDATKVKELKRFDASTSTATIAVAPVAANLFLDKKQINCGEQVRLSWTSREAADVAISANGLLLEKLPLKGERLLQPKTTTTYEFRAAGPGGIVTSTSMVDVNTAVRTSLMATPVEVRYHKLGDNVVTQGETTLKWTADNADTVHINPLGPVYGTQGTTPLTLAPVQTGTGLVDEMKTYTITATNACGGSDTSTASIHLTGSVEQEVAAGMKLPQTELPATASPLPLLALLGFGSLASGLTLRSMRKKL